MALGASHRGIAFLRSHSFMGVRMYLREQGLSFLCATMLCVGVPIAFARVARSSWVTSSLVNERVITLRKSGA